MASNHVFVVALTVVIIEAAGKTSRANSSSCSLHGRSSGQARISWSVLEADGLAVEAVVREIAVAAAVALAFVRVIFEVLLAKLSSIIVGNLRK